MYSSPEDDMTFNERAKMFFAVHWKGVFCLVAPIILIACLSPFPPKPQNWCGYTIALMTAYWVTECIPLEITAFLPVVIFPFTGVLTAAEVCKSYMNDIVILLLGGLFLAYGMEQSGLLKRFAFCCMGGLGKSHACLLYCLSMATMVMSLVIPNTAATAVMVPVVFTVLKIYENQGLIKIYDTNAKGEKVATDLTTGYFCAITFAATCGGVATFLGTATNLAMKGLLHTMYPMVTDHLHFLGFTRFFIIPTVILQHISFLWVMIVFLGVLRDGSDAHKKSMITKKGGDAVKKAIAAERKKLPGFSLAEAGILFFLVGTISGLICRAPEYFLGWADRIVISFMIMDTQYVRDSAFIIAVCVAMFLLPGSFEFIKNFTASANKDLPKTPQMSLLNWPRLNSAIPFSFVFILGAGFALVDGAKVSGFMESVGHELKSVTHLPYMATLFIIILLVVVITNFASNVVVASITCPFAMKLAQEMKLNPIWFCLAAGLSASFCFVLPIGTPGNLLVYRAANIPLKKMMIAGAAPTLFALLFTWVLVTFVAPFMFPDFGKLPLWTAI